jgi:hypothetical protein
MLITRTGKPVTVRRSVVLTLLACGWATVISTQDASAIEEIPDPSLPDIAAVQYRPGNGPVIVYNPYLCQQAGRELCEFYRYHEYGHIALRHYDRKDISAREKEEQADRWAARHAPSEIVRTAWRFFAAGGGSTPTHGDGPTRAARLVEARNLLALAGRLPDNRSDPEPLPSSFNALAL